MVTRKIAVVGLGYVGLPLAAAFSKWTEVIAFDISDRRIQALRQGVDATGELESDAVRNPNLHYTTDAKALANADFIIVTVPTPLGENHSPDLTPLKHASATVGANLSVGTIVVYESTVFPGATEEICVPILEEASGLICGEHFKVGYSPERINPGDRVRTVENVVKVVSGQDAETLQIVAAVYENIIHAGIHRAPSIRVAEASKVIENTQRDVNIALMNELAIICLKMGLKTSDVLEAAATKWNFLKFAPGLVGGHCIGVDPYYLTYKAESLGYSPYVILSGRRINDGMGKFIAKTTIKKLTRRGETIKGLKVLILGLTFKENVPDIRNTRVVDIIRELEDYGVDTLVHDPLADPEETRCAYGLELCSLDTVHDVGAIILAVPHRHYLDMEPERFRCLVAEQAMPLLFVDVKACKSQEALEHCGFEYWSL